VSFLLEAVEEARETRDRAEACFRDALRSARKHHSLSEIGRAAKLTAPGVRYLLKRGEKKP
jgi:hypothetical protein